MKYLGLFYLFIASFHSLSIAQESEKPLDVYVEETNNEVKFFARNNRLYPQTIELEIMTKGIPSPQLPEYFVVPPGVIAMDLASITIPENKTWSYRFGYRLSLGNIAAKHNDDVVYRLPYPAGKSYTLSQGYNGRVSHQNTNALDFTMTKGDTIVAARSGIVVRMKADENKGCPSPNCAAFSNYITILHDDDTMAEYVHFQQNGVLVKMGDEVTAGTPIGLAGATGQASGPHLHFIVYSQNSETQINFKTRFQVSPSEATYLTEGQKYTAFSP